MKLLALEGEVRNDVMEMNDSIVWNSHLNEHCEIDISHPRTAKSMQLDYFTLESQFQVYGCDSS